MLFYIKVRLRWGRTVTIEMMGFGRKSVWEGGLFWIEVEGLVFTVEEDECVEVARLKDESERLGWVIEVGGRHRY